MIWNIKHKTHVAHLQAPDVLELLIPGIPEVTAREELNELGSFMLDNFQIQRNLASITPTTLFLMGMTLGYVYHVFSTMNEVEVVNEQAPNTDKPESV